MINQLNRCTITRLPMIKMSPDLRVTVDQEVCLEAHGAANRELYKEYLKETSKGVAILGFNGQRYDICAMRVMLDENFRLKSKFEKAVLTDAVRRAFRNQFPECEHIQVDISWKDGNEEEGYFEFQSGVFWNYRRQYQQFSCYIRYD